MSNIFSPQSYEIDKPPHKREFMYGQDHYIHYRLHIRVGNQHKTLYLVKRLDKTLLEVKELVLATF